MARDRQPCCSASLRLRWFQRAPRFHLRNAAPATRTLAPTPRRCRTTIPRIRHAVGAGWRSALERPERRGKPRVHRLPQRCSRDHEGSCRTLPCLRLQAGPPDRSGAADQPVQGGAPACACLAYESKELLSLSAFIAKQSRGEPIAPPADERFRPFLEAGREQFNRRQGQLNLSCGQCHDDNWGKRLAGSLIPQAHPTGYPLYRLEWQAVGSLQRRLRNCIVGMRAEPYDYGATEYVSLELYLMWRARGLPIETPAVRP